MATWKELSNFTYGKLKEMQLKNRDLKELSLSELLSIAQKKLDRFKTSPEKNDFPFSARHFGLRSRVCWHSCQSGN